MEEIPINRILWEPVVLFFPVNLVDADPKKYNDIPLFTATVAIVGSFA